MKQIHTRFIVQQIYSLIIYSTDLFVKIDLTLIKKILFFVFLEKSSRRKTDAKNKFRFVFPFHYIYIIPETAQKRNQTSLFLCSLIRIFRPVLSEDRRRLGKVASKKLAFSLGLHYLCRIIYKMSDYVYTRRRIIIC